MNAKKLIKIIRECAEASAQRWDMAVSTDDAARGFGDDAAACAAAYDAALEALEDCYEDYLGVARGRLEEARSLEQAAGDDQDARRALDALKLAKGN